MHTGTLSTFHTAAFIQELSLCVKGIKTKTQPCHHHDSSPNHRSPGVVICSGLLAESSKDSFYDADLSVCKVRGAAIYLHSSDEAMGERVLFKAFQKGSHESRLKASPRKLKEFLFYLAQRWGKIVCLHVRLKDMEANVSFKVFQ